MKTQTPGETIDISREKLVSIVGQLLGGASGRPNPDEPFEPRPWDPIADKIAHRLGEPHPIPWRFAEAAPLRERLEIFALRNPQIWEVIGGWGKHNFAELNPQPIPPRTAFIDAFAREAIDRVLLTQEIADAMNQTGEKQSKIIVGDRLSQLVDYFCGTIFKFPIPRPKHDTDDKLSGIELLTAGAIFEQTAKNIARADLRQEFRNAGAKLIETGISRI